MLPGSLRLVKHLCDHKIPIAVATSTPRETFRKKMEKKPELRELLKYVVCGDEVPEGKPAPDVFLAAAKLIGADPADCLVLEDAPSGVEGAKKAGMRVVVAPSLLDKAEYPVADEGCSAGVCESIPSLLAFNPETYGLPPFDDLVHPGVIPIDHPIIIKGTVVRGLGRGSKDLGIPTANVDSSSLAQTLAGAVTGIYSGWVSLADSETIPDASAGRSLDGDLLRLGVLGRFRDDSSLLAQALAEAVTGISSGWVSLANSESTAAVTGIYSGWVSLAYSETQLPNANAGRSRARDLLRQGVVGRFRDGESHENLQWSVWLFVHMLAKAVVGIYLG
eukprot:gene13725-19623_t